METQRKNGGGTDFSEIALGLFGRERHAGRGASCRWARPGAVFFLSLFLSALVFPAPAGAAEIASWNDLVGALSSATEGSVLTLSAGTITFGGATPALEIKARNLTLRGAAAAGVNTGMDNAVAGLAGGVVGVSSLKSLQTQAQALTNQVNAGAEAALTGMSAISGGDATRNSVGGGNADPFLNRRKWLNVPTTADASLFNGLNLANLRFDGVKAVYGIPGTAESPSSIKKAGVVNGLIGNSNSATHDTSLGDITGNAFTNLSVTMNGYFDTQYLAGGGIIGVRATGEKNSSNAFPPHADARIGAVSGNYFNNVQVTTTDSNGGVFDKNTHSAYIEGGGLIGVDAASTPADMRGVAEIGELTDNLFTNIAIRTDDILIGGGLVGLNNNSKHLGANIVDKNTYVILSKASGNVFGGARGSDGSANISVATGWSLRGGGVIGLNGLSTAGAELGTLHGNLFSGIDVESKLSYIKGGGIVGLQTNYDDGDKKADGSDKFADDPAVSGAFVDDVLSSPWTTLGKASGNLFLDSNVTAATYLYGGGIVGLRSSAATAYLNELDKNVFQKLTVTASGKDGDGYGLRGGGVVGVSSKHGGLVDTVSGNYFDDITVNVNGGKLAGGGVIGIQSDSTAADGIAAAGDVIDNYFTNIRVSAGAIEGGGVVGAHGKGSISGFGGSEEVYGDGLSGNRLRNVVVKANQYISGGGVFGVYSDAGRANMYDVNNNLFDEITVKTDGYIEGGGLIGIRSNGVGVITNLEKNYFYDTKVTAAYIDGGGLIGVTSGIPASAPGDKSSFVLGIENITDNLFLRNTVTAENGNIAGGLIYSYGTTDKGLTIRDSYLGYNTFSATGRVYGTVTVDTGHANALDPNAPYTLTLEATNGYYTFFGENKISDEKGGERYNAIYFGTVEGVDPATGNPVDDDADADAKLVIKASRGGTVYLLDPIEVNQNNGRTFDMEVVAGDDGTSGNFLWWGNENEKPNEFVQDSAARLGEINLNAGTHTQIFDLKLNARNHTFNLKEGGELSVWEGNEMTVREANLNGDLIFDLWQGAFNKETGAVLKVHSATPGALSYVNIEGSTVRLTPFSSTLNPQPGDRFYLIATDAPDSITGSPTNGWASSYARGGYTTGYNFIIDTSVRTDPDDPESETATDQYLVARLPD
ncbi:MAG: hypothetical protein LBR71_00870, partial [Synergistaceae bacterium]|nr:hypothetical protein [Synergistaceae bacterium]